MDTACRAIWDGHITSWEMTKRRWDVSRRGEDAAKLGNIGYELKWISDAGYVYHDTGDLIRAAQSYRQALYLAKQIGSREDIINALEDLARVSVETGKLEEASGFIDQAASMERANGNRLSAYIQLDAGNAGRSPASGSAGGVALSRSPEGRYKPHHDAVGCRR